MKTTALLVVIFLASLPASMRADQFEQTRTLKGVLELTNTDYKLVKGDSSIPASNGFQTIVSLEAELSILPADKPTKPTQISVKIKDTHQEAADDQSTFSAVKSFEFPIIPLAENENYKSPFSAQFQMRKTVTNGAGHWVKVAKDLPFFKSAQVRFSEKDPTHGGTQDDSKAQGLKLEFEIEYVVVVHLK